MDTHGSRNNEIKWLVKTLTNEEYKLLIDSLEEWKTSRDKTRAHNVKAALDKQGVSKLSLAINCLGHSNYDCCNDEQLVYADVPLESLFVVGDELHVKNSNGLKEYIVDTVPLL